MSEPLDLLAIGAHPDDVEVHVGGILALATAKGLRAGILDLTEGDLGTRGTPETRRQEAAAAAEILGVTRTILDFPDGRFTEEESFRLRLIRELRRLRPAVVILPPEVDRHPDHERAHRLCREAAFYAGLRNYPCEGDAFRPQALAWVGGENPGIPDLVVDVTPVWDQRMRAFDAFGSQFTSKEGEARTRISSPTFRAGIEGRSRHWGSLILADHGEALWCDKPVAPALLDLWTRLR